MSAEAAMAVTMACGIGGLWSSWLVLAAANGEAWARRALRWAGGGLALLAITLITGGVWP